MKSKTTIIVLCILLLTMILGLGLYVAGKNNKQLDNGITDTQQEEKDTVSTEKQDDMVIYGDTVTLQIEDVQVTDKLEDYPLKEKSKYCVENLLPKTGTDVYIMDRGDVVEKNAADFVFVTCKITNTAVDEKEGKPTSNLICVESQKLIATSRTDEEWDMPEVFYFDKASFPDGDSESFYFYELSPGEELEYTLGYAVKEKNMDYTFTFGLPLLRYSMEGDPINPSDETKLMKPITVKKGSE